MKKLLVCAVLSVVSLLATAQNNEKSLDDSGRISISVIVPRSEANPLPAVVDEALITKLQNLTVAHGMASISPESRFIIFPALTVLEKKAIAGTKPLVQLEAELTLFMGDIESGNVYSQCSKKLKSVQTSEQKALISAVQGLKSTDPEIRDFFEKGKQKVMEYYNSQIDFILAQAASLKSQEKYDEALALLMEVPEICQESYLKAREVAAEIYPAKIARDAEQALRKAKSIWAASHSKEAAAEAAECLSIIPYSSPCYPEAQVLLTEISRQTTTLDSLKRVDRRRSQEKQQIRRKEEAKDRSEYVAKVGTFIGAVLKGFIL